MNTARSDQDEIDLKDLFKVIWGGRWMIAAVTVLFSISSICYSLLATEWYRAQVLLAPAEDQGVQGLSSQLGGLAGLAGFSIGRAGTAEPLAALNSREFAREFIEEKNLLSVLLTEGVITLGDEQEASDDFGDLDIRDAVKFFRQDILEVSEDSKTGLVTLSVEWVDPATAAAWATTLVDRLNDKMRKEALEEAQINVAFLRGQLAEVNVVPIQQSIGRLLESELQKLMLARGKREFSFRVVDPASVPKYRHRPKRTLIVILSTALGLFIGVFVVVAFHIGRRDRQLVVN